MSTASNDADSITALPIPHDISVGRRADFTVDITQRRRGETHESRIWINRESLDWLIDVLSRYRDEAKRVVEGTA